MMTQIVILVTFVALNVSIIITFIQNTFLQIHNFVFEEMYFCMQVSFCQTVYQVSTLSNA